MAIQEREGLLPIRWRRGRGTRGNGLGNGNVVSESSSISNTTNITSASTTTTPVFIPHTHRRHGKERVQGITMTSRRRDVDTTIRHVKNPKI